jgi:predicted RNase H-like nuclease (RuvC/YqgF family)
VSTHRCEHDNVVSDQMGEYRCYQCEPLSESDLEALREENRELEAENDELRDELRKLEERVKRLESRSAMDIIDERGIG